MPDDAPFDPCRAWLGIDAADLVASHLVLGIAATETDPLVIVRAADRRLTDLRAVDAGSFAGARDALAKRVEECRDAMLAGAVTARSLGAPPAPATVARSTPRPLAPPPPPAAAPAGAPPTAAAAEGPHPTAARPAAASFASLNPPPPPSTLVVSARGGTWSTVPAPLPVPTAVVAPPVPPRSDTAEAPAVSFAGRTGVPRRAMPRREGSGGGLIVTIIGLAATAAALALYVLWPQLSQKPGGGRTVAVATPTPTHAEPKPKPRPPATPAPPREPDSNSEPEPKPQPQPTPRPRPAPEPAPTPRAPEPPPQPSPVDDGTGSGTTPAPEPPMADPAEVRARTAQAVSAAWKAIRRLEFDTANRALAAVADAVVDDQQSADRVAAWQQLATYAREFPGYRDQALAAAGAGREYMVAGRPVAIVEVRPDEIIYRDRGRNVPVPRDAIPPPLEMAVVSAWFAADGRAANHLFLGAAYLARENPDVAAARREWEQAAQGGEPDGRLLLRLLDDPVVRGD